MHYSAKRGIEIAYRPSVCNVGGSGPYTLEILETNCTDNWPNTFALCSPKAIHLLPGEQRKILGRLEVGKVACWSTNAAISLKRVKIEEKLLWRAYRNSPTLFRTVPTPTLYGLLFPKIRVCNPKTSIDLKFGRYFQRVQPNECPFKILEKRERERIQGLPKFFGYPYYLRNG